jgi:hypothetical protein
LKTNNEIRLLNAVSDLSRKVDQLQRTGTQSAFFYGTHPTTTSVTALTETQLPFDNPIYNQGIICHINSQPSDTFTVMSSGLYLITLNLFLSPAVADCQMRISVEPAGGSGFLQRQQVNMVGSSNRTGMAASTTQYLAEGDTLQISIITPTDTVVTVRQEGVTAYKSPHLTIAQLTGEYAVTNSPNEWYGEGNEDL